MWPSGPGGGSGRGGCLAADVACGLETTATLCQKRRRQSGGEQITRVEVKCYYRNIFRTCIFTSVCGSRLGKNKFITYANTLRYTQK